MFTTREHQSHDDELLNEQIPAKIKNKLNGDKQKIVVIILSSYIVSLCITRLVDSQQDQYLAMKRS